MFIREQKYSSGQRCPHSVCPLLASHQGSCVQGYIYVSLSLWRLGWVTRLPQNAPASESDWVLYEGFQPPRSRACVPPRAALTHTQLPSSTTEYSIPSARVSRCVFFPLGRIYQGHLLPTRQSQKHRDPKTQRWSLTAIPSSPSRIPDITFGVSWNDQMITENSNSRASRIS